MHFYGYLVLLHHFMITNLLHSKFHFKLVVKQVNHPKTAISKKPSINESFISLIFFSLLLLYSSYCTGVL